MQVGTSHVLTPWATKPSACSGAPRANIVAIRPLKDGVIADFEITEAMLRHFIHKIAQPPDAFKPRQALRHPQLGRAAAVVVDPNNGDVLAMASVPSFDPGIFIDVSSASWKKLNTSPPLPLVSRAVSAFPPGSTFKIVTALGGLAKNKRPQDGRGSERENGKGNFRCPGGIYYGDLHYSGAGSRARARMARLGLTNALEKSCDCYF